MTRQKQKKAVVEELPSIPDYPEAPLPAWKHYGIASYADQQIRAELDRIGYEGYLIGLEVSYTLENDKTYAMSFGKLEPAEGSEESDNGTPLSDAFLSNLYQVVGQLIHSNAPEYLGEIDTELSIITTGSENKVKVRCRKPQVCDQGHKDKRWCKKVNQEKWTCMDGHPKC